MFLFWEQGYEGVSVDQLRIAMGNLSTASIYAVFGSKQELFRKTIDRYAQTFGLVTAPLFDETLDPKTAIEQTLRGSADMQAGKGHPPGCMVALSSTLCPPSSIELKKLVASHREKNRAGIRRCVEKAAIASSLTASDVEMIATMYEAFLLGISTQIRDLVPLDSVQTAITGMMSFWDKTIQTTGKGP